MHISNVSDCYVNDINDYVGVGETLKVVLKEYDDRRSKWSASMLIEAKIPSN